MEVTTDIKKGDLIWFNLAIIPKTRSTYMTILFIAALFFAFIAWEKGLPQSSNDWLAITVASIGGGIGGMFAGIVISFSFILLSSSAKNGILGKHEYRISQEGLYEKTSANEGVSKWEGIQEVQTVGSYLLYRISGYLFHIIPYRSFPSDEARKEFESVSIQYWKNAHNK
ncbi:MAG: YcxB family protein [Candidatus Thiodiazotropha sp. (ex Dulcina madagascariensis)]|nr:YcxB family protein [Candidatus Thiodiazotropha sp. (ex Dulcina madagascariensis)]MCU7925922.1 YcxB family protein [Candidatus Thiodiazotropha sp. (ex Dulcina madagascariensis)]